MKTSHHFFKLKKLSQAIAIAISLTSIHIICQNAYAAEAEKASTSPASQEESQQEQINPLSQLDWHIGPKEENIANVAKLKTQKDDGFLDPINADKFLEFTGNLTSGSTNILVAADDSWWATFDFADSGYIKDDEKIDADALLTSLKESDEPSNEQRELAGLPKLYTVGWAVPPHYDEKTKRLEWALKVRTEDNHETINYTIRLLGRTGVMSATLISDEEHLTQNIDVFKQTLSGFDFNSGERYSEYKPGDKVAEYGLAALITGGAVAVAAKKGLLGKILVFFAAAWKFIAIGVIACFGWLASLFRRNK